ncbi:MAG: hypothetical protein H0W73_05295 [Bacteroidetes bacterium]|nr:hypothetical protein [Bacteroidota bacterium]
MNKEENIKNRFSQFEPEVDAAAIEMGWQKIKYFVPQKENKKRAGFFFLYGAAALVVLLGIAELVYLSRTDTVFTNKKELTTHTTKVPDNNAVVKKDNTIKEITSTISDKNNVNETTNIALKKDKEFLQKSYESNTSKRTNNTKKVIYTSVQKNSVTNNLKKQSGNDSVVFNKLDLIATSLLTQNRPSDINISFSNDYFFPKPVSPFSVDLFAGAQLSQTNINQNAPVKNNHTGFLIGISLNHHLRNKFIFTGQFIFSQPNLNYTNTLTQNKIVSQSLTISSTPSSSGPDTMRYINANTNTFIRSKNCYHAALGLEYQLIKKNKISIHTNLLFDLRVSEYDYGYTREFGKDILVHLKGTPNNPKENLAPSTFVEGDFKQSTNLVSFGLMPAALFSYAINTKTRVIFKPAYFIDLSENNLIINSSSFKLKENNLMLNLGLRINL